ncbi:hypothetical protein ACFQ3Z_24655 [Streptomyces nogalater]
MCAELFPEPDLITATVLPPTGRAVRQGGGYLLSGRWTHASGITHADRVMAGFQTPDGTPAIAVFDAAHARVLDTWHTTGLRGTGSHDFEVADLFVPDRHTFRLVPSGTRQEPLHLRADNLALKMAGVPLGIGRAALKAARDILTARRTALPWPGVPADLAHAESLIGAADAYVYSTLEKAWAAQAAGLTPERGTAALARRFAHRACREAAQLLYDAVGTAAVYTERTPLDRCLRDLITASRHIASSEKILDGVGDLRLGGAPASPTSDPPRHATPPPPAAVSLGCPSVHQGRGSGRRFHHHPCAGPASLPGSGSLPSGPSVSSTVRSAKRASSGSRAFRRRTVTFGGASSAGKRTRTPADRAKEDAGSRSLGSGRTD